MSKLEAIRKAVIMASHPECETYEEALEKDYAARGNYVSSWQFLKEDGSEAPLEDQTEETIDKLFNLLPK